MQQHGLIPDEDEGDDEPQIADHVSQWTPGLFGDLTQHSTEEIISKLHKEFSKVVENDESQKGPQKKGKGSKLSHEEIRNLSTEELFSYIENEGKKLKQEKEQQEQLAREQQ